MDALKIVHGICTAKHPLPMECRGLFFCVAKIVLPRVGSRSEPRGLKEERELYSVTKKKFPPCASAEGGLGGLRPDAHLMYLAALTQIHKSM
jgi:hypothetical protein